MAAPFTPPMASTASAERAAARRGLRSARASTSGTSTHGAST
ncbi:MAG: hypothetical protein R2746_13680 [Acidimicrobiales bacterium]